MTEQYISQAEKKPNGDTPSGFRGLGRLVGAIALLALVVAGAGALWYWSYPDAAGPARSESVTVNIPQGAGVAGITRILADAQVIDDDIRFVLLVRFTGAAKQLQAGEYSFAPGMTPRAALGFLTSGKVVQHAITVPEGLTVAQIADIVSAGGWGSRDDFIRLAADPEILKETGVSQGSAEGYLFPDTYYFVKGTSVKAIFSTMLRRMALVLAKEGVASDTTEITVSTGDKGKGEQKTLSLSRHEVLTLASIIEKETSLPAERPLVSRVFLNRLRQGMKLQADPTVVYGLSRFGSPLTRSDLETENPYNTYVNRGLPIGPICNPSRAAISAVVHPSAENYYYFVAQGDGTHYFSKTLAEHNQAVSRYRKKRLSNRE